VQHNFKKSGIRQVNYPGFFPVKWAFIFKLFAESLYICSQLTGKFNKTKEVYSAGE